MNEHCPDHNQLHVCVSQLERSVEEVKNGVHKILEALQGDLEKRGWLTRIEQSEKDLRDFRLELAAYKRAAWGSIITFMGGAAVFIWALITHSIRIVK